MTSTWHESILTWFRQGVEVASFPLLGLSKQLLHVTATQFIHQSLLPALQLHLCRHAWGIPDVTSSLIRGSSLSHTVVKHTSCFLREVEFFAEHSISLCSGMLARGIFLLHSLHASLGWQHKTTINNNNEKNVCSSYLFLFLKFNSLC